jgi:hypothetical protein
MLPTLAGCVSEEEKAMSLRSQYKASLSGFTVVQEPRMPPGEGAVAVDQDVLLDLAVNRGAGDAGDAGDTGGIGDPGLPGVTVDVVQLDAAGREKRRWRIWVDTAGLAPGSTVEAHPEVKDVDYRPGDRFAAEVRGEVPPAERGDYRELSGGPSGS